MAKSNLIEQHLFLAEADRIRLSDKNLLWVALVLGMIFCSVFAIRAKGRIMTYWNHRLGLPPPFKTELQR